MAPKRAAKAEAADAGAKRAKVKPEPEEKEKEKEAVAQANNNDDDPDLAADSDTEYSACDLKKCPSKLQVAGVYPRLEGIYDLMPNPSRGRPCYRKKEAGVARKFYLYWYKTNKWFLGTDLGGSKHMASLEAKVPLSVRLPPCEPYPSVWKVLPERERKERKKNGEVKEEEKEDNKERDKKRTYESMPSMRIINAAMLDTSQSFELKQPFAKLTPAGRRRAPLRGKVPAGVKKEEGALKQEIKDEIADVKVEVKEEMDAEALAAENAANSDDDVSSDDSDDSGESSSSDEPTPKKETKTPKPAAAKSKPEAPKASPEEIEKRKGVFEKKLTDQLSKLSKLKAKLDKLEQVQKMAEEKKEQIQSQYGLETPDVKAVVERVKARLTASEEKEKEKARQQVKAEKSEKSNSPDKEGQLRSALRKPPMGSSSNGAVRKDDKMKKKRRITFAKRPIEIKRVPSFKSVSDLWFQNPGYHVQCEVCDNRVVQNQGSLMGNVNGPNFAQSQFVCVNCQHAQYYQWPPYQQG